MQTSFTKGSQVACPASLETGNLINSGAIHYTTAAQIAKHGVCRKCRRQMKKHGKAILAGKVETPVAFEKHHFPTVDEDHAGFADGEITQAVDFDHDEIDIALGLVADVSPDARQQAGELVRQLMAYCFKSRGNLKTAAAKFAVIGAGLRPDALNDASQTELAAQLNLTKAALSKCSINFQKAFGIKFARSRSKQARARMAARRLGGPDRHRKAAADGHSGIATTPAA